MWFSAMLQASITALLAASTFLETTNARNVLRSRELSLEDGVALDLAAPIAAWKRAFPDAPSGYTPRADNCPATRPSIRSASSLSPEEVLWLPTRRQNTVAAMRDLLGRLNITGLDTNAYIDNNSNNVTQLPNIGLAFSGGGYRALMNGAGAVAAFDSRTPNSTSHGHIGGVLQSATYIAGLSGGSWLVGSLYVNNFTSVQDIINTNPDRSGSLWQFSNSVLKGPATSGIQVISTAKYYSNLVDEVTSKADASGGFNTSLTDYWGRGLSQQLINATDGGPAYTWSSVANDPQFTAGNIPLPFIVADGRAPNEVLISSNTTIFEFSPWEMGSWDPRLFGFAPLRYTGSNFSGGVLPESEPCIRGFDNAGFVMGTSSSLFNQILLQANTSTGVNLPDFLKNALVGALQNIGERQDDISAWQPNPFYGYNNGTNLAATSRVLTLVDGGEDLQNIPLYPLIQPTRNVDVILAVDSSADTTADNGAAAWPNGTALVATYQRSLTAIQNGTAFPAIPDQNTIVNLGLNTHPTFFGCDAANMTGPAPLVVYIPNAPYAYPSNVSTFTLSYNTTERNAIVQNGYDVATMANATVDPQWPTCLGCAILSRSLNRTGTAVPEVCARCFDRYCWNGTVDSATPPKYEPALRLTQIKVSGARRMVPSWVAAVVAVGVGLVVVL